MDIWFATYFNSVVSRRVQRSFIRSLLLRVILCDFCARSNVNNLACFLFQWLANELENDRSILHDCLVIVLIVAAPGAATIRTITGPVVAAPVIVVAVVVSAVTDVGSKCILVLIGRVVIVENGLARIRRGVRHNPQTGNGLECGRNKTTAIYICSESRALSGA